MLIGNSVPHAFFSRVLRRLFFHPSRDSSTSSSASESSNCVSQKVYLPHGAAFHIAPLGTALVRRSIGALFDLRHRGRPGSSREVGVGPGAFRRLARELRREFVVRSVCRVRSSDSTARAPRSSSARSIARGVFSLALRSFSVTAGRLFCGHRNCVGSPSLDRCAGSILARRPQAAGVSGSFGEACRGAFLCIARASELRRKFVVDLCASSVLPGQLGAGARSYWCPGPGRLFEARFSTPRPHPTRVWLAKTSHQASFLQQGACPTCGACRVSSDPPLKAPLK